MKKYPESCASIEFINQCNFVQGHTFMIAQLFVTAKERVVADGCRAVLPIKIIHALKMSKASFC